MLFRSRTPVVPGFQERTAGILRSALRMTELFRATIVRLKGETWGGSKLSADDLKCLAQEFRAELDAPLAGEDRSGFRLPSRKAVTVICRRYVEVLFPVYYLDGKEASPQIEEIRTLLCKQICSAIRFQSVCKGRQPAQGLEDYADGIY